ncbi:MAG: carbohydrate binding family 9 domain-containing protein [Gemmatimonadetes bacterium]|nr:carbohydrate binding family 9 domain-containing protein [Gemmatimonadota bacterium]
MGSRIHVVSSIVLGLVASSPHPLTAQQSSAGKVDGPPAVAIAVRATSGAPRVDGVMDDLVWQLAPVFSGFVQRDPNEGEPATEKTEFRVLYTDDALYIGVRAYDSKVDEIAALLTRRDEHSPSDQIAVMIDSYRDRRTAFQFGVNPAGVKQDAFLFDDNNQDNRWDAVWDVATSIDAEGWTAEFLIPFNQLRFTKADMNTFGFNVYRRVNRLNEEQYWRPLPKEASGRVSLFGDLTGIESITPPRRLEIMPYTLARMSRETAQLGNPFRTGSAGSATAGADIKFGLGPALTVSATINPDFGQVEADPAVVNLSAFESFFPERRPFFNEGLDIFRFRLADGDGDGSQEGLFYTRRIGRRPQGSPDARGGFAERVDQTTILAAAKISGKTEDGWSIGFTGAVAGDETAQVIDANGASFGDIVEPSTTYIVGRLSRDLREGQTKVGVFATMVQRSLPERLNFLHRQALTGGFDWTHRFNDDTYQFSGRLVGSYVQGSAEAISRTQRSSARYFQRPDADHVEFNPNRTTLGGVGAGVNFGKTAGNWRWATGLDTRSPGLEVNDIGFQRSADQTLQWIWVNRRWLQPGKVFRRFNVNLNQWSVWNYGWERLATGGNMNANFTLTNYWNGYFGYNRQLKSLSTGQLRGGPAIDRPGANNAWFGFQSDSRKSLRGGAGGWIFLQDDNDSRGAGVNVNLSWRPLTNMDFTASPGINWNRDEWQYLRSATIADNAEYIFGDLHQTTVSMTFRGNVTLSPTFSLQAYMEPFVSVGRYDTFRRIDEPRAATFWDQFETFDSDQVIETDGAIELDFDGDGTGDLGLGNPDFTFLSFRSNLVLRWEYSLGSTMFLVWQHGRTGFNSEGRFDFGSNVSDLFKADFENVLLFKVNYWISP